MRALRQIILMLLVPLSVIRTAAPPRQAEILAARQTAVTRAIETVSPAVAGINVTAIQEFAAAPFTNDPLWNMLFPEQIQRRRVKSLGSGVVISEDGYIVTNSHVVANAQEIVVALMDGAEHDARIVGVDDVSDVALLKIKGRDFTPARLGDSDDIIIGEWVVALGNPFGLFNVNFRPTATVGIISGKELNFGQQRSGRIYQDMIQTDASINTGNSGGPLINALGEVIGLNTFIFTGGSYSEGSVGVGFALPINRVKSIVEELKRHGKIDRSFRTGLAVQNIDRFLASYLQLSSSSGVIVTEVERGSSAGRAGIKVGDVITHVNGKKIRTDTEIIREIQENFLKAGDVIELQLLRGQENMTIRMELGK